MKFLPNGDLVELPVVRPITGNPQDFHDTLLKAEKLTLREREQLAQVLDNYIED